MQANGFVDLRIAAELIGTDRYKILTLAIHCHALAGVAHMGAFLGREQIMREAAHAFQNVNGGIMILRGQLAREHKMPV